MLQVRCAAITPYLGIGGTCGILWLLEKNINGLIDNQVTNTGQINKAFVLGYAPQDVDSQTTLVAPPRLCSPRPLPRAGWGRLAAQPTTYSLGIEATVARRARIWLANNFKKSASVCSNNGLESCQKIGCQHISL